jgi:hypothetical protein
VLINQHMVHNHILPRTAVNQMDQVTQQNAAMVEQTNAASAALTCTLFPPLWC